MNDLTKKILKIAAVILAFALIISSVFIVRSCSAPPEYSEIRERVEELIEASFDINDIVWGKGLPTYKRVTAPTREFYESGKTYLDADGNEQPLNYYYYYIEGTDAKILAFREQKAVKESFSYALLASQPTDAAALALLYPLSEGQTASEELYTEIYSDVENKLFVYLIPYLEPTYEFYYLTSDPVDYDYVLADSKYASVDAIKDYIRTVYSSDYADSLDSILFDGVMEGELVQKARYTVLNTSRGSFFASLNTFEPLFAERRVYLLDTANIDRSNSNDSSVVVEFDTYLPSSPDKIVTAKLNFTLQSGTWYLSSPTY